MDSRRPANQSSDVMLCLETVEEKEVGVSGAMASIADWEQQVSPTMLISLAAEKPQQVFRQEPIFGQ